MSSKNMYNQAAVSSDQFPFDPAFPFKHAGRALAMAQNDTGSRIWNLYLASLPPHERRQAAKSARGAVVHNHPSCYWPKPKSYPRGQTVGAGKP